MARKDAAFTYGQYWLEPDEGGRGIWYRYWHADGRVRRATMGTRDLDEASARLKALVHEEERVVAKYGIDTPLSVFIEDYRREKVETLTSAKDRVSRSTSLRRLEMWWGQRTVEDVTEANLDRYEAEIEPLWAPHRRSGRKGLSRSTLRNDRLYLSAVIGHAIYARRLEFTLRPDCHVGPPRVARERWLTREEAATLLEGCRSPHMRLLILMALATGSRRQALLSMRREQVDLVQRRIYLNPQGREQTNKRRPVVPMGETLACLLEEAFARSVSDWVFPARTERGFLVDVDWQIKEAVRRSGLRGPITLHTLRHTAGTWMAQAGRPMWDIAGILGHSVQRTTELYAHHHPDYLRDTAAVLDDAVADILRSQVTPNLGVRTRVGSGKTTVADKRGQTEAA